jgi:N-hydroxyarylamine O-acetyltransferase
LGRLLRAAIIRRISGLDLDRYLARIGYSGPKAASLATLQPLHALHPAQIAFENLDVLLGRPVRLDVASLASKLVDQGRGGYCFEHNTLFQAALQALGFSVISIAARPKWHTPEGMVTPRTHMVLRIRLPEGDHIADVGYGRLTLTAPLRLEADTQQETPHGHYRLVRFGDEFQLQAKLAETWTAIYQISIEEQAPADWELANWYTSTHPDSVFTRNLMAARSAGDRRYGLFNNVLSIRRPDGTTERHVIETQGELGSVLRNDFNIKLPEACDQVLARPATGW